MFLPYLTSSPNLVKFSPTSLPNQLHVLYLSLKLNRMFHGVWFVLANYPWRVVSEKCVTSMKKTDFPSTVAINVNSSLANYGT